MRWLSELVERVRALLFRSRVDAETAEEMRFHMEMEAARLQAAEGLSVAEARRRAAIAFGGVERHLEEVRDARGWGPLSGTSLDVKLAGRMLVKYPGLTIMGTLAIAFAIWVGAGTFEFIRQVIFPVLPLPDGERIVAIENRNLRTAGFERRLLHDFTVWREQLRTIEDLGAYRSVQRNLITGEGLGEPVEVAEISASAFRVARTAPLYGRVLTEADERPGAPAVAVIGHDIWRTRFAADPLVVGRTVSLGRSPTSIVGVMPEGFGFPVSQNLWVPLRLDPLAHARGEGPGLRVFGRLVAGASLEAAQAEVTAIGQRLARLYPETHAQLRPEVLPHARSFVRLPAVAMLGLSSINLLILLLIALICGNVALLMFARAATRENELVVRSALGAGRGRLVLQLFIESLVLGAVGASIGLLAAGAGLRWLLHVVHTAILDGEPLPFWISASLSPPTLLYATLLTVFTAVITGVLPGFKVTGRNTGTQLRQATAGGGGFRFGGIWTAVLVLQIAITVAFPAMALELRRSRTFFRDWEIPVATERFVSAQLEMDREPPPGVAPDTSEQAFLARYEKQLLELERRLEARPDVRAVTFARRLPLMYHPHRRLEVEGGGAPLPERLTRVYGDPTELGYWVAGVDVALDYFDALGAPVLRGRGFRAGDLAGDAHTVIVTESFARLVLGGRNPLGTRVRYRSMEERNPRDIPEEERTWYTIVGVVPDLGTSQEQVMKAAAVFHPASPGAVYPVHIAVQVHGDPTSFVPALRSTAAAVEPSLRLYSAQPLRRTLDAEVDFYDFWYRLTVMVSLLALILSLAGIYAVMSHAVARRTREIGIRVALGASATSIILATLRRPLRQVFAGVVLGAGILYLLFVLAGGASARAAMFVAGHGVIMLAVCLLACIAPTRRALRIQPTDAIRVDG